MNLYQKIKKPLGIGLACVALATSTGCGERARYLLNETKVGGASVKIIKVDCALIRDYYMLEISDSMGNQKLSFRLHYEINSALDETGPEL